MIRRILHEPLIHFAVLAVFILGGYGLAAKSGPRERDQVVVTASRVEQLALVFAKTRQRPPDAQELKGLIDDYVKEEIYSREAIKLGLDQDDAVIRRRLRQKMEFLNEAAADQLVPQENDLSAFLNSHHKDFEAPALVAFEQVFFSVEHRGNNAEREATVVLQILSKNPEIDISTLGDPSSLPAELPLTSEDIVARTFGTAFADAVTTQPLKRWIGPLKSEYGLHLVRVTVQEPGRLPTLVEVHDAVLRDWKNAKRTEIQNKNLDDLLRKYDVNIETVGQDKPL